MSATTLAAPLRAALDSFAAASGARVRHESGGSLELARRISELARTPDVLALADREVFDALLVPAHASWYAGFARNRMVLAYTDRSRGADRLTPDSWRSVVLAPGVEVARSDPAHDPMGYRALLLFALAERHYGDVGLAARLERSASARHLRARSSELVALLETGEVDYAWTYESVARTAGLRWLQLPGEIDLGSAGDSSRYAAASVRVPGRSPRDSVTIHGRPILYALSIPREAPHRVVAGRFVAWLLSPSGRSVLRAHGLDALDAPIVVGDSATPFGVARNGAVPSVRVASAILIPGGGPRRRAR
jgi:molybdate/tungstate transport system substrate-binding protein